jgi:hypothetical protein
MVQGGDVKDGRRSRPTDAHQQDRTTQAYGRRIVEALGTGERTPLVRWRPGVAGTAPDGTRLVLYHRLIRAGGSRAWRTNNPGNIEDGSFACAHGAIGHDGRHAVFPDERTGLNALQRLFRSTDYSDVPVGEALSRHELAATHAAQANIDPATPLGSIAPDQAANLTGAIAASHQASAGAVYQPGSPRNPAWAKSVFAAAPPPSAGTSTESDLCYINFPQNWQIGLWYERLPAGGYVPSHTQDPVGEAAIGIYAKYLGPDPDGVPHWHISAASPKTPPDSPPPADALPPWVDGPNYYSINRYTSPDGTSYTVEHFPPNTNVTLPANAVVIPAADGGVDIRYNDAPNTAGGNPGSDSSGSTGPDPGGTSPDATGTQDATDSDNDSTEGDDDSDDPGTQSDAGGADPDPDPSDTQVDTH